MSENPIANGVSVKNFLKSFYQHHFFVEKDKRKEGERIFLFSKGESLPKKFIEDLLSFNGKIKINGNKVGQSLGEWQGFIKYIREKVGKERIAKSVIAKKEKANIKKNAQPSSAFMKESDSDFKEVDQPTTMNHAASFSEPLDLNESKSDADAAIPEEEMIVQKNDPTPEHTVIDEPEFWKLSKAEFLNSPPESVLIIDSRGSERYYQLEKDKKGYTVFDRGIAIISSSVPSVHQKLICQAYAAGKTIDEDRVLLDYPYFNNNCSRKIEKDNAALSTEKQPKAFSEAGLNEKLSYEEIQPGDIVLREREISTDNTHTVGGIVTEVNKNFFIVSYPASPRAADQRPTEVQYQTREGGESWRMLHEQSKTNSENQFVAALFSHFEKREKLNKRNLEKIAGENSIQDITRIYELAEYAWIKWYRKITKVEKNLKKAYVRIVEFYTQVQPTFSLRDSVRVEFQQYSTPAPIAYLAQQFCKVDQAALIFEPSAGNGLLVFACPYEKTVVNELDKQRLNNLRKEPFRQVLNQDAELPFQDLKGKADAVLSNPPFGRLTEKIKVDGYNIKILDHAMITIALETMKDSGRAVVIIGGHTTFTEDGRIRSFRIFFNWLFHFYHVSDIINIDGDLYAKQGTSFDIRMILLDGRKQKPEGFAPIIKDESHPLRTTVRSFEELFDRVSSSIENPEWLFPKSNAIKVIPGNTSPAPGKEKSKAPLWEIPLYQYGITSPLNLYDVKKVSEVDLEKEDWYRLAHKATHNGAVYYTMAWKPHYEAVKDALEQGIKVRFEVISDYPALLRQFKDLYGLTDTESFPLTYEEWIRVLVYSKNAKTVTLFSSLDGEVFYTISRAAWERKYERDEEEKNKLLRDIHRKYIERKINPAKPAAFQGQLLLIINQIKISLQHEVESVLSS